MKNSFPWIFGAIAALELISNLIFLSFPALHYATKPLIMIALGSYFVINETKPWDTYAWIMLFAIIFSWLGDMFLMIDREKLFIFGLGSFLLTHIGYCIVFAQNAGGLLKKQPWWFAIFLLYGTGLFYLLFPALGEMMIPVFVYAATILTMVLFAINRKGKVNDKSFWWVYLGAIAFMLSDSIIALNKFTFNGDLFFASIWIMSLYMLGQYLIVLGYLNKKPVQP